MQNRIIIFPCLTFLLPSNVLNLFAYNISSDIFKNKKSYENFKRIGN